VTPHPVVATLNTSASTEIDAMYIVDSTTPVTRRPEITAAIYENKTVFGFTC
jgi:hypothetical protein